MPTIKFSQNLSQVQQRTYPEDTKVPACLEHKYWLIDKSCKGVVSFLSTNNLLPQFLPETILVDFSPLKTNNWLMQYNHDSSASFLASQHHAIIRLCPDLAESVENAPVSLAKMKTIITNPTHLIEFVFLHELAHIIFYHAYINRVLAGENTEFCPLFNEYTKKPNNKFMERLSHNIEEVFADTFAIQILKLMYPNNTKLLKEISNYRKVCHSYDTRFTEEISPVNLYCKKYDMDYAYDYMLSTCNFPNNINDILHFSFVTGIENIVAIINKVENSQFHLLLAASLKEFDNWDIKDYDSPTCRIEKLNHFFKSVHPELTTFLPIKMITPRKLKKGEEYISKLLKCPPDKPWDKIFNKLDIIVERLYIKCKSNNNSIKIK